MATKQARKIIETISGLNVMNALLRDQNAKIRENIDLRKGNTVRNSLATMSGLYGGQTPITSFAPMLNNSVYAPLTIDWNLLQFWYKTSGVTETIIDMPVDDAFRGDINIRSKMMDPDDLKLLGDTWKKKGVKKVFSTAGKWTRLFGGGAVIASTNSPMEAPLDMRQLARDGRVEFYAANRWELMSTWRTSPTYNFYGKTIDASHVFTMVGKEAPYTLRWQLAGWGMSELERLVEELNTYIRVKNVIYELLQEAKVDVYKFKDFANQMLSAEAEQATNRRMQITNAQKSYNSAILMDSEDEFEQRQITFSGLADIYREARIELASAAHFPMRRLFDIGASGLSAESSSDTSTENYNAMVEGEVREQLRPAIMWGLNMLCTALFGDTFEDLDFEWAPLASVTQKEEQEINDLKFNRLMGLFDRGLVDEVVLTDMLAKEKLLDSEVELQEPPEPEPEDDGEGAGPRGK